MTPFGVAKESVYAAMLAACIGWCLEAPSGMADDSPTPSHPNIVFVLADDLGYTDLGCYGSQYYESPNIDRLAAEGRRFTSGYSCGPNCQPTRAALMSGQYGPRTGVYTVGSIDRFDWRSRTLRPVDNVEKLSPDKITIAESLQKAGYVTGLFGKWHLGDDARHHPLQQGFNEAIVSAGLHFGFTTQPPVDVPADMNLADFLTDRSIDFMRRHRNEPFFLCLHHFAVHAPHEATWGLIKRFANKPAAGGHHDPVYAAMIASIDESVGRLLDTLDELQIAEKTLVIFTSDNGGVGGYEREGIQSNSITDNAPLRGGKGMLYEGGIRVPYIFRWKTHIEPGSVSDSPINSVDLYPTLQQVTSATVSSDYALDGTSYLSLLIGNGADRPRGPLFWHFPGYLGASNNTWRTTPAGVIRSDAWKLIEFFEDGRLELYNLDDDIGERHDVSSSNQEVVARLHAELQAWRAKVGAPLPAAHMPEGDPPRPERAKKIRKTPKQE